MGIVTEGTVKYALRIAVTLTNLPLFAIGIYTVMSEKSADNLLLQVIFAVLGVLALVNIVAPWRWRSSAQKPFGMAYRLCRAFGWALNLILFFLIGVGAGMIDDSRFLWIALPSGTALLALALTCRTVPQKKDAPDTEYQPSLPEEHAQVAKDAVWETAWEKKTQPSPARGKALIESPEPLAYYAAHKPEIDRMQREYERLLVEKYGFQPAFVREIFAPTSGGVPAIAEDHRQGKSAAIAADEFFSRIYHSPDVNNPQIFAYHAETGEALPPDFDHDNVADRILGRTAAQKKATAVALPLVLLGLYYMNYGAYIPSKEWLAFAGVLAVVFAYPLTRLVADCLRHPRSRFVAKIGDFKWMLPIAAGFLFFSVTYGLGYALHGFVGDPMRTPFAYTKRDVNKGCLNVSGTSGRLSTKYCLRREDAANLPQQGSLDFHGRKSWFGASLDGYYMPFN